MRFLSTLSFVLASVVLSACGGGGGGSSQPPASVSPPPPAAEVPLTGQFIDSEVAGLRYETDTQSGTTNAEGEFEYLEGESVRFYFGTWMIGEIEGQATVTPFNLYNAPGLDDIEAVNNWLNNAGPNKYFGDSRPLNRAVNLAFLLLTLDLDSNADNGIVLPETLDNFTEGYPLNLNRGPRQFLSSRAVRGLVSRARESGLWSQGLRVQSYPLVLKHLTEQHFPNATMNVQNYYSFAVAANGLGTPFTIWNDSYDVNGNLIQSDRDNNGDGTLDSRTVYADYNEFGQAALIETDQNVDGSVDASFMNIYTDFGAQVRQARDQDNDGTYEYDWRATYNDAGQQTEIVRYDDGALSVRNLYFYHSDGTFDYILSDTDGDGVVDVRRTYTSEDGLVLSIASDEGDDGTVDSTARYEYNLDGDRTLQENDNDGDGNPDLIVRQTYNEQGLRTFLSRDDDGDGIANVEVRITYNDIFQVLEQRTDQDGDGVDDLITLNGYSMNGFRTAFESDEDADGVFDRRFSYTLDESGNQTASTYDSDGDGTIDQTTATIVGEFGQVLQRERDDNADGVAENRTIFEYELVPSGNWFLRAGSLNSLF